MEETVELVLTIRKDDLPKIVSDLGITEYHFKNNRVTADLTSIYNRAVQQQADINGNEAPLA